MSMYHPQPAARDQFGWFLAFVAITYVVTWAFTGSFIYLWRNVFDQQIPAWLYVLTLGVYAPSFVAIWMARRRGGRDGVRQLLARLVRWRVNPVSWLIALFYCFALAAIAISLTLAPPAAWLSLSGEALLGALGAAALFAIWFGPLPEELGWRGFATPLLLERYGVLVTSLLVSLVWTFWHTPMFWFPGAAVPASFELSATSVFIYWLGLFAQSVVMTVLIIWSRGSVLLAILFHLTHNICEDVLLAGLNIEPTQAEARTYHYVHLGVLWVGAALVYAADRFFRRKSAGDLLGFSQT
jgi:uncharacterized protein